LPCGRAPCHNHPTVAGCPAHVIPVANRLAAELAGFSTFVNSGVHLVGDGESVSFEMKQDKAPLLANALYYAEDMQRLLIKLARAL